MIEDIQKVNLRTTPRLTAAGSTIAGETYRRFIADRAATGRPTYGWQINFQGDIRELTQRATYSGRDDGLTSRHQLGPLGGGPGRNVYLQDLLAQGTTKNSHVVYAREVSGWTNAADSVAGGDDIPEQTFDLEEITAAVTQASVFMKVTQESLADYTNLETFVSGQMVRRVKLKIEDLVLNSDGTSPNRMIGFQQAGLPTVSIATAGSLLEAIEESIALIESNGYSPSFVALNPTDKRALYSASTAKSALVWDGSALRLHGLPVLGSAAVTAGTGLVGDGSQAAIMYNTGIGGSVSAYRSEKTNADQDDFIMNLCTIRAVARAALVIQSFGAFVEITA